MKRTHREFDKLKDGQQAPIHIHSRVKKGVDIFKVFKKAQAVKYENRADLETDHSSYKNDSNTSSHLDNAVSNDFNKNKLEILKKSIKAKNVKTNNAIANKKIIKSCTSYDDNTLFQKDSFSYNVEDFRKDTMSTNLSEELTIKCENEELIEETKKNDNNGLSIDEILEIYESKAFESKEVDLNEEYDFNDWSEEFCYNIDERSDVQSRDLGLLEDPYFDQSGNVNFMNFGCEFAEMHQRNTIAF